MSGSVVGGKLPSLPVVASIIGGLAVEAIQTFIAELPIDEVPVYAVRAKQLEAIAKKALEAAELRLIEAKMLGWLDTDANEYYDFKGSAGDWTVDDVDAFKKDLEKACEGQPWATSLLRSAFEAQPKWKAKHTPINELRAVAASRTGADEFGDAHAKAAAAVVEAIDNGRRRGKEGPKHLTKRDK